ncbi:MAG: TetR/AcrR family transcriptional regulator [Bradymonadales bacterium]
MAKNEENNKKELKKKKKGSMTNDEMRAAALQAARRSFTAYGYFGSRVDTIATEAKVNKRMIYAFYDSKIVLYAYVRATVANEIKARLNEKLPETGNWHDDARATMRWCLELYYQSIDFVRLVMWESMVPIDLSNLDFNALREEKGLNFTLDDCDILDTAAKVTDKISTLIQKGVELGYFKEEVEPLNLVLSSFMSQGYFASLITRKADILKRYKIDLNDHDVHKRVVNLMVDLFFKLTVK